MQRTLVQNRITGVTEGFTKVLEITGVGYRANSQGKTLKLNLGYSHDVDFAVPEGIEIKTPDHTTIEISGIDKQKVGQAAAEIRRLRQPDRSEERRGGKEWVSTGRSWVRPDHYQKHIYLSAHAKQRTTET